jgi:hypothetical protein
MMAVPMLAILRLMVMGIMICLRGDNIPILIYYYPPTYSSWMLALKITPLKISLQILDEAIQQSLVGGAFLHHALAILHVLVHEHLADVLEGAVAHEGIIAVFIAIAIATITITIISTAIGRIEAFKGSGHGGTAAAAAAVGSRIRAEIGRRSHGDVAERIVMLKKIMKMMIVIMVVVQGKRASFQKPWLLLLCNHGEC